MYVWLCLSVYISCIPGAYRNQKKVLDPSGTGITNSCELPWGCWELKLGPLEEQPVFLTTESSQKSQIVY